MNNGLKSVKTALCGLFDEKYVIILYYIPLTLKTKIMKKNLLSFCAMALLSMNALAQWTLPEVKTSDLKEGEVMFLYNKEANAFFRGLDEYWGTRAGVGIEGADSVKIVPAVASNVPEGTETSLDYDIPWLEVWDNETYLFQVYVSHNQKRWDETWFGIMAYDDIWIDRQNNTKSNVNFFWKVEKNSDGSYAIKASPKATVFADPDLYESFTEYDNEGQIIRKPALIGNERLGVDLSSQDLVACFEGYNGNASLSYDWYFVTKEDFEAIDFEQYTIYNEAMSLKAYIDASKAEYPTVDFSAAEAVYNNTSSTLEELKAAKELVKKAIVEFQSGGASPSNPKDMTAAITNASFDIQGDFTGWKGTTYNAGGNASTCAEFWNYDAFNAYQDLADLPAGIYKLGAKAIYRAGGAQEDYDRINDATCRYVKLYARTTEDSLYTSVPALASFASPSPLGADDAGITTDEGTMYLANSMYDFTAYKEAGLITETNVIVPVADGKLRIGVAKNQMFGGDWFVVDDYTLLYYGNSLEAYEFWRDDYLTTIPDLEGLVAEDALYNKAYLTAIETAIATAKTSTDKDVIAASVKAINPAIEALHANVAAYAAYAAKVAEVEAHFAEHDYLAGDSVDYIVDYLGDESAPGEYYPNGGARYILENQPLTTEKVIEETANVERWFQAAVRDGMAPGSDVSYLLTNPNFDNNSSKGWTWGSGTDYAINFNCVEKYEGKVDFYQTVENVPAGIYSISVQAFERPTGNGGYDGTESSKTFLFMNDSQTPVQNITVDVLPEDEAIDRENCLLSNDYLYTSADGVSGWVPNGMEGASIAFAAGRYYQKCYGIVGEDGVMTVGLTSNGQHVHWVLWDKFQLVYKGKNAESIKAILETTIQNAIDFKDNNEAVMNTLAKGELEKEIANAQAAIDTDYDTMNAALENLVAAIDDARDHVEVYSKFEDALWDVEETFIIYDGIISDEGVAAYEELSAKFDNTDNMTNAELQELIDECAYVIALIKMPAGLEDATDDEPIDLTEIITNADFAQGNANGWTLNLPNSNSLGYQGASYTNGDVSVAQFVEAWRTNNTPLENGTIEQTLRALPAGTYVLGVDIIVSKQNGSADDTKGVFLFASEDGGDRVAFEVATENGAPQHFELTFKKENAASAVTIGIETRSTTANWIAADNFTLVYYGTASGKVPGDGTGIEGVDATETVSSTYYTLGGVKVAAPVKGVNIVKSVLSNGAVRVQKVIVK